MKKRKVLSPHLQIYDIFSKSMTSSISILDRMSFLLLLPFLLGLMLVFIFPLYSPVFFQSLLGFIPVKVFYTVCFAGLLLFFYHFYATFRFILIELGFLSTSKKAIVISAYFIICLSLASALLIFSLFLS